MVLAHEAKGMFDEQARDDPEAAFASSEVQRIIDAYE